MLYYKVKYNKKKINNYLLLTLYEISCMDLSMDMCLDWDV